MLEPIALEMTGAEMDSTEEALGAFQKTNKKMKSDPEWRHMNMLMDFLTDNAGPHSLDQKNDNDNGHVTKLDSIVSGEDHYLRRLILEIE